MSYDDIRIDDKGRSSVIEDDTKIRADWQNLSEKQRRLISEFLKSGKKYESYVTVYHNGAPDFSRIKPKTVLCNAYAEFRKPHIKVIITQIREKAIREAKILFSEIVDQSTDDLITVQKEINACKIDSLWVLKRAALLADFNINKFIRNDNGDAVYDFSEATEDDWYCIQEYVADVVMIKNDDDKKVPVSRIRLRSYDKLRALELVGRHVDVGAFKDTIAVVKENDFDSMTDEELMAIATSRIDSNASSDS